MWNTVRSKLRSGAWATYLPYITLMWLLIAHILPIFFQHCGQHIQFFYADIYKKQIIT